MNLESLFSLKGKNAIVVGGSKGIGNAMAKGLAAAGADVVLASRNQAELDAAAVKMATETGAVVTGMSADVSTVDGCRELVDKVVATKGHVDILVNCAGVNQRATALDFTEEQWDIVQNTQLKGVFFMCQAVARQMVEKGIAGKIINVGSISSVIGLPKMISYCSAKGGVVHPYYVRCAVTDRWLESVAEKTMGDGVVTAPVSVETMLTWAREKLAEDPALFLAAIG